MKDIIHMCEGRADFRGRWAKQDLTSRPVYLALAVEMRIHRMT